MQVGTDIKQDVGEEASPEPLVEPKGASTWYEVLEVSPRASDAVIQAAYRALARTAHPDLNGTQAAERMRELNRARDILSDPHKRAIYDLNIGQQRTSKLIDGKLGGGVRRAHTCWQCDRPISACAAYCGRCRWLVCEACRSCGCQHPEWQRPAAPSPVLARVGPLTRLGWLVVAGLATVLATTGAAIWAIALRG